MRKYWLYIALPILTAVIVGTILFVLITGNKTGPASAPSTSGLTPEEQAELFKKLGAPGAAMPGASSRTNTTSMPANNVPQPSPDRYKGNLSTTATPIKTSNTQQPAKDYTSSTTSQPLTAPK